MPSHVPDPTKRFTNRAEDYVRWRPGYPAEVLATLAAETQLPDAAPVADIGSGTGISTRLLLGAGWTVYAVEPNDAMRAAAEQNLAGEPGFRSVAGTAEATTLPADSVDMVVSAQAFHWFDPRPTREEMRRILKADGFVALLWNTRDAESTPFLRAYERLLLAYAVDYRATNHRNITTEQIRSFITEDYRCFDFPNDQVFDFEGLKGRLLSSSYAPAVGHPVHREMMSALKAIFEEHSEDGKVRFIYRTELHLGRLGA